MTRRNAIGVWNGPNGMVIRWKCNCGHEGFLDHTGSHADPDTTDDRNVPAAQSTPSRFEHRVREVA